MPAIEATHLGPVDERNGSNGWTVVFWVGKPFDYSIPFRSILDEIVAQLAISANCRLELPSHEDNEDFVEGTLTWGMHTFEVYFEHSLGYLSLSSLHRVAIDNLSEDLSSIIEVDPSVV